MKAITVSNFRTNLKSHLDEVSNSSEIIIIPRNNNEKDAVVVMSIDEYNSIKETEYLMSTEANRDRLRQSLEQVAQGKTRIVDIDSIGL